MQLKSSEVAALADKAMTASIASTECRASRKTELQKIVAARRALAAKEKEATAVSSKYVVRIYWQAAAANELEQTSSWLPHPPPTPPNTHDVHVFMRFISLCFSLVQAGKVLL